MSLVKKSSKTRKLPIEIISMILPKVGKPSFIKEFPGLISNADSKKYLYVEML